MIISLPLALPLSGSLTHSLAVDPLFILVGVAIDDPDEPPENVAVPPVIVNEKSLTSKSPVPLAVLYAASLRLQLM